MRFMPHLFAAAQAAQKWLQQQEGDWIKFAAAQAAQKYLRGADLSDA